jgi:large subunit ribosomal protein L10
MNKPKAYVSEAKKKIVRGLLSDIEKYPIIGLVNMENLPAPQLQKMKQTLRGKVELRMTKSSLIKIALKHSPKNLSPLADRIEGMPALLFTNENPFKLYKILSASKSAAPAKPGQKAPHDVTVPAGKTSFAPGPVIGELGQMGIKAGIEDGKVAIKQDKLLVKEGEVFSAKAAELLTRLNILPMEVGLNVIAVYEEGVIFDRKVLEVDEKQLIKDLQRLHNEAIAVAMHIGYISKDTITSLIGKAEREASALSDLQKIEKTLAKAEAEANALKEEIHIEQ